MPLCLLSPAQILKTEVRDQRLELKNLKDIQGYNFFLHKKWFLVAVLGEDAI